MHLVQKYFNNAKSLIQTKVRLTVKCAIGFTLVLVRFQESAIWFDSPSEGLISDFDFGGRSTVTPQKNYRLWVAIMTFQNSFASLRPVNMYLSLICCALMISLSNSCRIMYKKPRIVIQYLLLSILRFSKQARIDLRYSIVSSIEPALVHTKRVCDPVTRRRVSYLFTVIDIWMIETML